MDVSQDGLMWELSSFLLALTRTHRRTHTQTCIQIFNEFEK